MKILSGHVSPETAYIVNDYPYGFVLRCKIRYWLEHHPKRGTRFVSQTTNPKRGDVWNKPKASTYMSVAGCMFLDDQERVNWSGIREYQDARSASEWLVTYGEGLTPEVTKRVCALIAARQFYDDTVRLQAESGAGIGECCRALRLTSGDVKAAAELLRTRGDYVEKPKS